MDSRTMVGGKLQLKDVPDRGLSFIEQLHALSACDCSAVNRPYLTGVSEENKVAVLTRPSCKMWNCPSCGARNSKRWIARIINHINRNGGSNWRFFTLTAHEKWRGKEASVINLRQGWKKLYNRIIRRFGRVEFVRIWEQHKDGSFHLHGLMNIRMGKKWLRDNARECGMGYQVDIRKVDNAGQVAGYISKYMVKSGLANEYPKGIRRIECSRHWLKLPTLLTGETIFKWYMTQTREGQLRKAQTYYERGFEIVDTVREENELHRTKGKIRLQLANGGILAQENSRRKRPQENWHIRETINILE